jgi:hypothetical protein
MIDLRTMKEQVRSTLADERARAQLAGGFSLCGTSACRHWYLWNDGVCGEYPDRRNRLAHRAGSTGQPGSLPRIGRSILANEWRNRAWISCGSVAHAIDSSDAVRDWKYGRAHRRDYSAAFDIRIAARSFRACPSCLQDRSYPRSSARLKCGWENWSSLESGLILRISNGCSDSKICTECEKTNG